MAIVLVVYVAMVVAFVCIQCWWSNRSSVVPNWPVFGMLPSILYNTSQIYDFLTRILQRSDGTFMFKGPWFCGMDFLITSHPMNVHHILSKNFTNYPKGPDFNQILETLLGDGIFNADSDSWRVQRTMVHSLLKDKRFELSLQTSIRQKISKGLFLVLDHASCDQLGNNEIDIQDVFQRFNFDNVCTLVFGMDPNTLSIELPHVPFEKAFDDVGQVVLYRHLVPGFIWKLQRWLQIGEEKKMTKACFVFDHFVKQCIETKQEQLKQNRNINDFDALTYFLQMKDNIRVSNKFIRDMALNLLFAGRDTTSAALSWTFWLIATDPSSQKKILQEMEQHFGTDHNDDKLKFFNFEKMRKLVYLHAVICEVLRLYPSVPFGHKVSIQLDVLPSGHHISKNTKLLYSLYSMGRMTDIWGEDCLEFKPERWISESGGIKHYPSYKFIAFNSGPRTCLGKDLVFSQMKAVICAILWNYSIELVEDQHVSPSASAILHQKNGLKIRVNKRKFS